MYLSKTYVFFIDKERKLEMEIKEKIRVELSRDKQKKMIKKKCIQK